MKILCNKCHRKLDEPGAVVLSPPCKLGLVRKFHLCVKCWRAYQILFGE